MSVQVGARIGRYEVESLLGSGGMGEVYRALDVELNRPVALKFLSKEFSLHPTRLKRFIQEARAASALNHPNIITVYEIGHVGSEETATPYFVTELIEGKTLKQYALENRLKLADILELAIQIASALAAAHAAGIVHRDIKPDNIMVRSDGYVKVLDFGLAKPNRDSSSVDSEAETQALVDTDPGTVMGTVNYMSPEQARGTELDARSDIWSLGVVLYELITGQKPFTGPTPSHVIVSLLEKEPRPLSNFVVDVPEALELIVEETLRKDREERIQTAKELLGRLRRLKQRIDAGVSLDRLVEITASPDPSQPNLTAQRSLSGMTGERGELGTHSGEGLVTQSGPATSLVKRQRWALLLILLAVPLVAGLYGIYKVANRVTSTSTPAAMRITRLTTSGRAFAPVISPDGKYVAHVMSTGNKQSLVLRQTATSVSRELVPATDSYFLGATFTPDGNYLCYLRADRGQNVRTLYQISLLGGDPRQLVYDVDAPISFSPDGKKFAFLRGYLKERERVLFTANADGSGEERMATRNSPEFAALDRPVWSPDGKTIAFIVSGTDAEGYYVNIDEVHVADKVERKISSDRWRSISSISWLRDGTGLLAVARDRGSIAGSPTQLWHISYDDGQARRITNDLNYYIDLSLAADSRTAVAALVNRSANVWIAPQSDTRKSRRVTTSNFSGIEGIAWAPDGRLVYTSMERENLDLWITNANGSNAVQLTFEPGADLQPSVCPDGRYVVFLSNRGMRWGIWRMKIDGSDPVELVRNTREYSNPVCSQDSQWVIYGSEVNNKQGLFKVPIDGGTPIQLVEKPAFNHTVSPDGKLLAYVHRPAELNAKPQVEIIGLEDGSLVNVFESPGDIGRMHWSPDSAALDYVKTEEEVSNIWRIPVNGGPQKQLTSFETDLIFHFAWSNDGRELACTRGSNETDLILIEDLVLAN